MAWYWWARAVQDGTVGVEAPLGRETRCGSSRLDIQLCIPPSFLNFYIKLHLPTENQKGRVV